MPKDLAPIALFVYNRPWHTQQTLDHLKQNTLASESILYVFADGEKEHASPEERKKIGETREIVKSMTGFKQVIMMEKDRNEGLANSIINGVTKVVNEHGKIIVLEDDLVVSPFFLEFMNEGLEAYADVAHVYSINGFMFPLGNQEKTTVLLPYTSTWGWATWSSRWCFFDNDMKGKEILQSNSFLANQFNLADYKYTDMLNFGNNSWGIKWYFSVFKRHGLNVFPTQSLVSNIGFDGSGTNGKNVNKLTPTFNKEKVIIYFHESITLEFWDEFISFFIKKDISFLRKVFNFAKKRFNLKKLK